MPLISHLTHLVKERKPEYQGMVGVLGYLNEKGLP